MAAGRVAVSEFRTSRGISLIESLITALVVTITVAGLLQFTGQILRCHQLNQAQSKEALELWNKGREIRRSPPESLGNLVPVSGARPLRRFILKNRYGREWEVLCAEK
jgi:Tfp pilus assembly protein PilV